MDSSSMNDAFLTEKSSLGIGADLAAQSLGKRAHRRYLAADRARFFAAFDRLGSIPTAARVLV